MGRHMESNARTTSSTLAPHIPIPHDLPALPGSDLAALRASIDSWDGHIPTAAPAPATVTAERVREQLAAIR